LVYWRNGVAGATSAKGILERLADHVRAYWEASVLNPYGSEHIRGSPAYNTVSTVPDSLRLLHIVQQVGDMPILAGTDVAPPLWRDWATPGFTLHAELAIYQAEGLAPLTALQSVTLNPAKMLGATDSLGTVAPEKLADLVLLDADPLADITNTTTIRAVVANGRYFDRTALDQLLADVQAKGLQVTVRDRR
jgi:hypothetical protein